MSRNASGTTTPAAPEVEPEVASAASNESGRTPVVSPSPAEPTEAASSTQPHVEQPQEAAEPRENTLLDSEAASSGFQLDIHSDEASIWKVISEHQHLEEKAAAVKRGAVPAADMSVALLADFKEYHRRLEETKSSLEQHYAQQTDRCQEEIESFKQRAEDEIQKLEQVLEEQYGQPPQTFTEVCPPLVTERDAKTLQGRGDEGDQNDAKKVIDFWKTKHAELHSHFLTQQEELSDMMGKLNDLRYLHQTTDQDVFKTHRLIGLLREREAGERLKANAYHTMLEELVIPKAAKSTPRPGQATGASGQSNADRGQTNPSFSVIDEMLISREQKGAERVGESIEERRQCLLHAQDLRMARIDFLKGRIETTENRIRAKQAFSLDDTLNEVLELRNQVAEINGDTQPDDVVGAEVLAQRKEDLEAIEKELDDAQREFSTVVDRLTNELRERKVEAIRALYRSSGDVDAQLNRLKVEQSIAVLSRTLSTAEEQRMQLKQMVSQTEDSVRLQSSFLERCK